MVHDFEITINPMKDNKHIKERKTKQDMINYGNRVLFHLIYMLLSITFSTSIEPPNIVKSLPGYPGDLPFSLQTGYVGVGEEEKVKLFYYFIESERDAERDPLMVWLTGGPGCSAFSGLVFEIGPLAFNFTSGNEGPGAPKLQRNPYSWTKVASIIFVDSPVGTGYSYATTSDAYYTGDLLQSIHIHDFLRKWLMRHPNFRKNSLYVAGDSYSGIIVPMVVNEILHGNDMGLRPKLNLKGYVLGNPVTNRKKEKNAWNIYAHRTSLVSDELFEAAIRSCGGEFGKVDSKNTMCLQNVNSMIRDTASIAEQHILEHKCLYVSPKPFDKISSLKGYFCRAQHYLLAYTWADDEQVREILNIHKGSIENWVRCNKSLAYTFNVHDSFDYHLNFTTKSLQILVYSGDQDMSVPYLVTLQWIKQLNITISDDWRPWFVDGQVAGYVTEFSRLPYRLVYTTIKGGGHTAPEYKPRECLAMIDRWFSLSAL